MIYARLVSCIFMRESSACFDSVSQSNKGIGTIHISHDNPISLLYLCNYIYIFFLVVCFYLCFLFFYLFISNHFTNLSYSLMVIYLIYSIRPPKQQSSIRIWERTCILYFLKIFQLFLFLSPPRFEQNGKNNFVSRENGWNRALEIGEK